MAFIGFLGMLLFTGMVVKTITDAQTSPAFLIKVEKYIPWVAEYTEPLMWASAAMVLVAGLIVTWKMTLTDAETSSDQLKMVGVGVVGFMQGIVIALFIVGAAYLLSLSLFAVSA